MKMPFRIDRTHWSRPDREWLETQHFQLGKTYRKIANELGCCKDTVQDWGRLLKVSVWNIIPEHSTQPPLKVGSGNGCRFYGVTREWLEQEYVKKDKSGKQIADEIGTSHFAVIKWLRDRGFALRDREAMNKRHSKRMSGAGNPAWAGGTARNYQIRLLKQSGKEKKCTWCGTEDELEVHHMDHNTANGDLDNLVWLCTSCNKVEAWIWRLWKSGRATIEISEKRVSITFI